MIEKQYEIWAGVGRVLVSMLAVGLASGLGSATLLEKASTVNTPEFVFGLCLAISGMAFEAGMAGAAIGALIHIRRIE